MEAQMEEIIKMLYEMHSQTSPSFGFFDKELTDKEWHCYDYLYNNLNKQSKEMLMAYLKARNARACHEIQAAYESGFKTAIKLFIESFKE